MLLFKIRNNNIITIPSHLLREQLQWQHHNDLQEVVTTLYEPKQLTDKDGLDNADAANAEIAVIDSTLYIAGTNMGRESEVNDNVT